MTPLPRIKKCSFVTGNPELIALGFGCWVSQKDREFEIIGPLRKTKRGAINAWNRKVK